MTKISPINNASHQMSVPNGPHEIPATGLEKFSSEFISDRYTELKKLKLYITSNEFEAVKKTAHNWKGFSKPYGFGQLATFSLELEKYCDLKSPSECLKLIDGIESYLKRKERQFGV